MFSFLLNRVRCPMNHSSFTAARLMNITHNTRGANPRAQFPSFNRSEDPLTLGHWHELHVSRTAKNGILQVDKQKVVEGMAEVRTLQIF